MFENGTFAGNGGNLVTGNPSSIDDLRTKSHAAEESYRQAKANRQAYRDSIRPHLEALEHFKVALWEQLFPKPDDDAGELVEPPYLRIRLEQFEIDNLRDVHQAGAYDALDRLNSEVAPLMEVARAKKQIEKLAEDAWEKTIRDLDQAVRRAASKKQRALPLFVSIIERSDA